MKNVNSSLGFVAGIAVGIAAVLLIQPFFGGDDGGAPPADAERETLASRRQDQLLSSARERIVELEEQLATVGTESGGEEMAVGGGATPAGESEAGKAASFVEMLMSFGDDGAMRKIDAEVTRLTGVLNLTDNQQAIVREALVKRFDEQKAAGVKVMTGKASIDDLLAADEHNFAAVDASIRPVLDDAQLDLYEDERLAREQKRVENKTEEELGQLTSAIELSTEQQDAAWAVLAELNAAEPPGEIPEGTTAEEFTAFIDGAIDKRIDGLEPILSAEQLQIYQGQAGDFRSKILALVGHATGAGASSGGSGSP